MIMQEKVYLCKKYQDVKNRNDMKFTEWIKQLREERPMPQRQFAMALEIDTATCCKIEKSDRHVKAELLALWLVDQVSTAVENGHKKVVDKALNIVKENIKKYK